MFFRRLTATFAFLAFGLASTGKALADEVRIGVMNYPLLAGLLYAKHQGYVEAELKAAGLEKTRVVWKTFVSGAPVSEALAAEELDFGALGATPALVGRASGQDTRAFALASVGPQTHALVVRSDLAVTKVSDLKGKRVATTFGSSVFELLLRILDEAGMTVKDVQLLNMVPADMSVALRTKAIDAAVLWDPLLLTLTEEKTVTTLRDGTGLNDNIALFVGRDAYAKAHSATTRAVLRGIERGNRELLAQADAPTTLAPLLGLSPEVTSLSLKRYTFGQALSTDLVNQLEKSASFMADNKLIRRPVSLTAFVDQTYQK